MSTMQQCCGVAIHKLLKKEMIWSHQIFYIELYSYLLFYCCTRLLKRKNSRKRQRKIERRRRERMKMERKRMKMERRRRRRRMT